MGGCLSVSGSAARNADIESAVGGSRPPARSNSRSSSSGDSTSSALQGLPQRRASAAATPPRLALKGEMLAKTLNEARSRGIGGPLVALAEHTLEELAANRQPGPEMTRLDVASLPDLVRAYNARYEGLDLQVMDQPAQLIEAMATLEPGQELRAIVRLYDERQHHFVADVRGHAPDATTVLVLEPAEVLLPAQLPGYNALHELSIEKLGNRAQWNFIENGAQFSFNDCLAFSLHTALCAYQNSELLDTWHEQLHAHGHLGEPDDTSGRFQPAPYRYLADAGMKVLSGQNFLPMAFFKHMHAPRSRIQLEALRPEAASENVRTGSHGPQSESISERQTAFEVRREGRKYSGSIEGSRATKVRVALEAKLRAAREE